MRALKVRSSELRALPAWLGELTGLTELRVDGLSRLNFVRAFELCELAPVYNIMLTNCLLSSEIHAHICEPNTRLIEVLRSGFSGASCPHPADGIWGLS